MLFSKSTMGFYDVNIHEQIPADALEVSDALYAALFEGQAAGKVIGADDEGSPVLQDPPPLPTEVLVAAERSWRDQRLSETDGIVARHRDEVEAGGETTLTAAQYKELQAYRQKLRAWPETSAFPETAERPDAPDWLSAAVAE
ncbi:phage tail assembly chaperone [Pseudomonas sp. Marseille-Q5115]|uniref:phage tail assembly chaperone n=1 Tax=Pseudomonas sp. Marseille-Q5115 TaxID=2866593 RepID=UPI001CE3BBF1|nr:phage tail assembly chaperone [Pseudomonas sp. Marseille-Q5115]